VLQWNIAGISKAFNVTLVAAGSVASRLKKLLSAVLKR
jgi:hypothetical protein